MNKDDPKKLYQTVEGRVIAGDSKIDIYGDYLMTGEATRVANILSQIAVPKNRVAFFRLNMGLAFIQILLTINYLIFIPHEGLLMCLLFFGLSIVGILNIVKFRAFGYISVLLIGLLGWLIGVRWLLVCFWTANEAALFLMIAATTLMVLETLVIGIAVILKKKLFPHTHYLLIPMRDGKGKPIFENS